MSAFIPNRREPEVTANALAQGARGQGARGGRRVRRHLGRPPGPRAGRDARSSTACWATARTRRSARATTSRRRRRDAARRRRSRAAASTEAGVRQNVSVGARATSTRGCGGNGAAAIDNLMEDAATAEISRSQLWQWRRHARARSTTGSPFTADRYRAIRDEELARIAGGGRQHGPARRGGRAARPPRPRRRVRGVPDPRGLPPARLSGAGSPSASARARAPRTCRTRGARRTRRRGRRTRRGRSSTGPRPRTSRPSYGV